MLDRVVTHLWDFRFYASDAEGLAARSDLLHTVLKVDGKVLHQMEKICAYLDDYDSRSIAKTMCCVGVCLRIIC